MSTTNRLFNEVVFENRNKSYGAYELRLKYVDRMARAVFTTMGIICAIATLAFFLKESGNPAIVKTIEGQIEKVIEVVIPQSDKTTPREPEVKTEHKPNVLVAHTDIAPQVKNSTVDTKPAATTEPPTDPNGTEDPSSSTDPNKGGEGTTGNSLNNSAVTTSRSDTVVQFPTDYPEFPGGAEALSRFLASHIVYPETAKENHITGTVFVSFIIDKTGKVSDIKPIRELPYGCTDAAIRAVSQMPDWKPGKNNGMPVKVKYTIPLKFSLR